MLALQQVIFEGLDDEILALKVTLEQLFLLDPLDEIFLREQWEPDVLHEVRQKRLTSGDVVLKPGDDAFVHLRKGTGFENREDGIHRI